MRSRKQELRRRLRAHRAATYAGEEGAARREQESRQLLEHAGPLVDAIGREADAARAALPTRELDEAQARALSYGQRVESAEPGRGEPVAAFAPDGTLVAVLDESRPTARPRVVLAPADGK